MSDLHGPFIQLDRARHLVYLHYGREVLAYRVDDDGAILSFQPHRSSALARPHEVVPSPVGDVQRARIAAWWRGEPPDMYYARGWCDGVELRGMVLDRCQVVVRGSPIDCWFMAPCSPRNPASLPGVRRGRCLVTDVEPCDPDEGEEAMLADVDQQMEGMMGGAVTSPPVR